MDNAGNPHRDIFPGTSELSELMRAHDWASTPLGPPRHWPEGLRVPLAMMLSSRLQMWLGWGPDIRLFYNDAYAATLGSSHPGALGQPLHVVWTDVFAVTEDRIRTVMKDGVATSHEASLLLPRRDGHLEEIYDTFSCSPLRGDSGRTEGLICVVTEETERVIGQRRLSTLHALADRLAGIQTREAAVAALRDTLATNRKDFPFSLIYLHDASRGRCGQASTPDAAHLVDLDWPLAEIAGGASHVRVELASLTADAPSGAWEIAPTQALLVPIVRVGEPLGALVLGLNPYRPDDQGMLGFAQLIATQISGALANIDALDLGRRRADLIWQNSRDLIAVIDRQGILRSISPSWTRILGHDLEEVVGHNMHQFVHPDDIELSLRGLDTALTHSDLTLFENRCLDSSGVPHWISWNTSSEGDLVYAYGRDITAEKAQAEALVEIESQLRQSQKMEAVGHLTGGIAHDFNNMLAVVTGSLEMLQRRSELSPKAQRYIEAAMDAARRSAALTQRLLAFSRRQPLKPESIDANKLVADTSELLRHSLGTDIRLKTVLADGLWRIHADPNQLVNVLLNIAVNARDAMPDGGHLTIETQNSDLDESYVSGNPEAAPGQYVLIAVSDTGIGMPPDVIARVFDPFFTTKEVGKGTGLGLSQVYGFIKQSNGHVKLYSEPGMGTTVKIYLPRLFAAGDRAEVREAPARSTGPRDDVVLVVEDETAVRRFSVDALQMLGYRVLEAEGATAALRMISDRPEITLLFTDVIMPDINGARLADQARQLRPHLKVLFTTGYTRNALVHNGVLDPDVELLGKPFSIDQLAAKVRDMIDR